MTLPAAQLCMHKMRLSCSWGLAISALAAACSAAPVSEVPRARPQPPPVVRERWARFGEASSWPAAGAPFRSQGHVEAFDFLLVRTSPDARDAYLALVTDSVMAEGAVIAAFHQNEDGTRRGRAYVMQKSGGEWRYLVLEADGTLADSSPRGCGGCHSGAVADRLFGPARGAQRL